MTHERIRLGISACLLGEPVRFDGGHKRDPFLVESLGQFVDWVPVCPKVESGLDAPRESMRLVQKITRCRDARRAMNDGQGLPATCGRIQSAMARSIERAQSSMFRDQGRSLGRVRDPNADDHWGPIAGCGSPPVGFLGRCGRCANSWTVATCRFGCHALPKGFLRASHIRRTARPADQARIDPIAPPLANQAVNRRSGVHAVPTHSRWRRRLRCCRTHTTPPRRSRACATVAASVAMSSSSYRDQYFRGEPCSRKYATRGQPAGTVASGTGGGSAATREIRYDPAAMPPRREPRRVPRLADDRARCTPFAPRPEIASPRRHQTTATAATARVSALVSPPSRRSEPET